MKFQILALAALGGLITPAFAVGVVPDSTCTSADTKPDCEYNGGHVVSLPGSSQYLSYFMEDAPLFHPASIPDETCLDALQAGRHPRSQLPLDLAKGRQLSAAEQTLRRGYLCRQLDSWTGETILWLETSILTHLMKRVLAVEHCVDASVWDWEAVFVRRVYIAPGFSISRWSKSTLELLSDTVSNTGDEPVERDSIDDTAQYFCVTADMSDISASLCLVSLC